MHHSIDATPEACACVVGQGIPIAELWIVFKWLHARCPCRGSALLVSGQALLALGEGDAGRQQLARAITFANSKLGNYHLTLQVL